MQIKYKNCKYDVTFCEKMVVLFNRQHLFVRRVSRYLKVFLQKRNSLLFLILTIIWGLIVKLLQICGVVIFNYDITDASLDILLAYVTSVIITISISIYNQADKYRTILHRQYQTAIYANDTFDKLFQPILKNILFYYMPFYNSKCLQQALIKSRNLSIEVEEDFIVILENALEATKTIKAENRNGFILENELLPIFIDEAEKELRISIYQTKSSTFKWEQFEATAECLESLVDCLRTPWRKDLEIDTKILTTLNNQNKSLILDDFYLRMWLYDMDTILIHENESISNS